MLLLAISTSTPVSSVALGTSDGLLATATLGRPHAHNEFLAPAIEFCRRQLDVSLDHLAGVAVDQGPGMFTGLRVGIATAKAIAMTCEVPMVAFPSLHLLAFAARYARRTICAVVDARRGEVFNAFYRPLPGGVEQASEFQVSTPDALASDLLVQSAQGHDVLLVGNGALTYRDVLTEYGGVTVGDIELASPSAETALDLAFDMFEREQFQQSCEIVPLYLRRSDAEIKWAGRREGASIARG